VNRYEGRPTDSQVARADALGRELEDIIREFAALTNQQLPVINRQLQGKKMKSINVISEQEWQKAHSEDEASAANTPKTFERD
jgi:hypothetical protein